jgi:hypothetical protein
MSAPYISSVDDFPSESPPSKSMSTASLNSAVDAKHVLALGLLLGLMLVLGEALGLVLGEALGLVLGEALGLVLGEALGETLGLVLGDALGLVLGDALGLALGVALAFLPFLNIFLPLMNIFLPGFLPLLFFKTRSCSASPTTLASYVT